MVKRKLEKRPNIPIGRAKKIQKSFMTFVVDFASTPIKNAPKTSTPVKMRMLE